jgi:hypothetical protein
MPYHYNPKRIYNELLGYRAAGVRVRVTGWRWRGQDYTGAILREIGSATRGGVMHLVKLDHPLSFEEHAEHVEPQNREALYTQLKNDGCIDKKERVTCIWAFWGDLEVEKLAPGVLVEYQGPFGREVMSNMSWPGRIVGVEDKVALLEVLEPTPFMDAPDGIVIRAIRQGFYADHIWVLGFDTYRFWKKLEPLTLPHGRLSTEQHEYVLDQALPLAAIDAFCKRHWPTDPRCVQQSVLLYILPLEIGYSGGTFRPLREGLVDEYAGAIQTEIAREIDVEAARRAGIQIEPGTEFEEWK